MDQQPDLNEHQELRELLREVLKTQELILRRIEQLEERAGSGQLTARLRPSSNTKSRQACRLSRSRFFSPPHRS